MAQSSSAIYNGVLGMRPSLKKALEKAQASDTQIYETLLGKKSSSVEEEDLSADYLPVEIESVLRLEYKQLAKIRDVLNECYDLLGKAKMSRPSSRRKDSLFFHQYSIGYHDSLQLRRGYSLLFSTILVHNVDDVDDYRKLTSKDLLDIVFFVQECYNSVSVWVQEKKRSLSKSPASIFDDLYQAMQEIKESCK